MDPVANLDDDERQDAYANATNAETLSEAQVDEKGMMEKTEKTNVGGGGAGAAETMGAKGHAGITCAECARRNGRITATVGIQCSMEAVEDMCEEELKGNYVELFGKVSEFDTWGVFMEMSLWRRMTGIDVFS